MRTTILTTTLAAGLLLALTPSAAQANPHHSDSIRYASIKGCADKNGAEFPCGPWRLVMHSGKQTILDDAQGVARKKNGESGRYYQAPIAVSGNGRSIAYFTKSGRPAVRTVGGGVKVFAKDALPRVDQWKVSFDLSDDGAKLAAVIENAPTRIFDTATGERLGTVPSRATLMGFSGDGDELLTSIEADESVTDLVVYSDRGRRLARATPPQVIGVNGPQALAADGRTVAGVVTGSKPELVTYDVEDDRIIDRKKIKLPEGAVNMIDWTGDTQVTLHLTREVSGSTRMTIVQIDTETGAVKVRDRYTPLKDSFVFAACGG
ncbi:hypothetical protein ACFOY2_19270 [Nonomuraea purpurea]|uniref:WD40 repeat domain-containing protein n=1 Tax=Nonomuraea purpurea TaxID=1849276 RepID=A0ABV8G9M2_9ACTN